MSNEEKSFPKTSINWYPGHMAKTKRQIKENIDLIDIAYEVIDARIPKSSKNKDIDSMIKNKPRILIMTKYDLCDEEHTKMWKEYYEKEGYKVVLVDLLTKPNLQKVFDETTKLLQELNEKRKAKGLKERKARAIILGIPNVGKSTLINRLVGKKATNVGNKPGITKQLEWIRINNQIELLDTPGILTGLSPTAVTLGYLYGQALAVIPVTSVSNDRQLDDVIACSDTSLTPEQIAWIDGK